MLSRTADPCQFLRIPTLLFHSSTMMQNFTLLTEIGFFISVFHFKALHLSRLHPVSDRFRLLMDLDSQPWSYDLKRSVGWRQSSNPS